MFTPTHLESIDYRVVVIPSGPHQRTGFDQDGRRCLRIAVPRRARHIRYVQRALKDRWNVEAIVVDYLSINSNSACVLAQHLPNARAEFDRAHANKFLTEELSDHEQMRAITLLGQSGSQVSRVGWIEDAICWVESETGTKLLSGNAQVEQYAAGAGFALLRFRLQDQQSYWLKATASTQLHERKLTACLARICADSLPTIVAQKPEWNAWLVKEEGNSLSTLPADSDGMLRLLERATVSLAQLQRDSAGKEADLLTAGAFDQRWQILRRDAERLFLWLSTVSTDLSKICELRGLFDWALDKLEEFESPALIIHGDLNLGNLIFVEDGCQFIDWSEGYIGCSFVSFEHLLLLNPNSSLSSEITDRLKWIYRSVMLEIYSEEQMEWGFACGAFLAVISTLYGRGEWLLDPPEHSPDRLRFTKMMLPHLERSAQSAEMWRRRESFGVRR